MPVSPNPDLYQLGRGIVYVAEFAGGAPGAYYDVGNCPSFTVEVTQEVLEHFNTRTGTKSKDKQVILEAGYTLEFSLDEISVRNLKMFLRGTVSGKNIYANMALNREYAIKFVSDNPVGQNQIWQFWRVKLSPAGAFNILADEWAAMEFSGEGLQDTTNHAESPYFTLQYITSTSTTTTTTSTSSSTTTTAP